MPVPYKVKFDDIGNTCPRNIIELRERPECGVLFREEQPFIPQNKFELQKNIKINNIQPIPKRPQTIQPLLPSTLRPIHEDPRRLAFNQNEMPQDDFTPFVRGRILTRQAIPNGYEPVILNEEIQLPEVVNTYHNQEADRVIEDLDAIMPTMVQDLIIQDELEAPPLEQPVFEEPRPIVRQSRIRVLPSSTIIDADPRDTEFLKPRGTTDEELIDLQIKQIQRKTNIREHEKIKKTLKEETELISVTSVTDELLILEEADKIISKNKRTLTENEVNEIANKLTEKAISPEKTTQVLIEMELYNKGLETDISKFSTKEKALLRRISATINEATNVSKNIQDSNLIQRQQDIELREDTPLLSRTEIGEDRPRSRIRKIYDKTAGKLPEEFRYKAKQISRGFTSVATGDPDFDVAEDLVFERTPASLKEESSLGRRLKLEALGVREKLVRGGKKLFTQEYTPLRGQVDLEMSNIEDMELRIPENEPITDLQDIDLNPFEERISTRRGVKLSFAERISMPRVSDIARGGAGAIAGVGIGFGVSQLLDQAKVNKYLNAVISGGAGDVGARILTYSAEQVAIKTGLQSAELGEALTAKTLLRGAAEGGALGLAAMPLDSVLNNSLRNVGLTHTASNMISTGVVGAGVTGAIWATGGAGAVETGGTSLILAGISVGALELIGFLTGQGQDRQVEKRNNINKTRSEFIDTLPKYKYDFIQAYTSFKNKDGLGIKEGDWTNWSKNAQSVFTGSPYDYTMKKHDNNSNISKEDQLKMQQYFSKYMIHKLVNKVCTANSNCSSDLLNQDKGELNENEINFLNNLTDRTWQSQADMQVNYSMKEMEYTQIRVQNAKRTIIDNWANNKLLPEQLGNPNILETAKLDPNFYSAFQNAVKLESQRAVVNAYNTNQTKLEQLPANIQKMAQLDKEFGYMINVYYNDMEHTAGKMNLSVPQLIQLQSTPENKQTDLYRNFQFDDAKKNEDVVNNARDIIKEEHKVREAGYYDIDQAYLSTDPTAINIWKPTDSQILQAHSAGMTLQQYVNYMGELAKGEFGDYKNLPGYSEKEIKQTGALDFSHFQDELQIAGFNPNMYSYDTETLAIVLNSNVSNMPIPSTQNKFISNYIPENVLKMRQETADLIHGLNQQNQSIIDQYNTQLHKELSAYGKNYDKMVASVNDNRSYHGINNLLVYNEDTDYQKYHMEFKPVKVVKTNQRILNEDQATQNQVAERPETGNIPVVKENNEVPDYMNIPIAAS